MSRVFDYFRNKQFQIPAIRKCVFTFTKLMIIVVIQMFLLDAGS